MNEWQFQYRRLQHDCFGDTFLAGTKYNHGNKYAKVFVKKFGCLCEFTMANKGDAHEALYIRFQHDGVPPKIIVGDSKHQTLEYFKREVAEAGFDLRQTELESRGKWLQR